jgi:hypothetical protein
MGSGGSTVAEHSPHHPKAEGFIAATAACTSDLYYKHITIINDAYRVIRIIIISDVTTWSITYDHN